MDSYIRRYNRPSIFPNLNLWRTFADAEHSRDRTSTLEKLVLRKELKEIFTPTPEEFDLAHSIAITRGHL
jgi:hypothetical protein